MTSLTRAQRQLLALCGGDNPKIKEWQTTGARASGIIKLLEAGLDPNFVDPARPDLSPMRCALEQRQNENTPQTKGRVRVLLRHGANPMGVAGGFDEDFAARDLVNNMLVLDGVWAFEQASGLRRQGADGSNPLHILAAANPGWAAGWILQNPQCPWSGEADEDGNTPLLRAAQRLHEGWAAHINRRMGGVKSGQLLVVLSSLDKRWPLEVIRMGRIMLDHGWSITHRNAQGHTAVGLIERAIGLGARLREQDQDTWARLMAMDQRDALEAGTAEAEGARRTPRL